MESGGKFTSYTICIHGHRLACTGYVCVLKRITVLAHTWFRIRIIALNEIRVKE